MFTSSDFFTVIVAGLALAVAFQLALTLLSVAAGVTVAGRKKAFAAFSNMDRRATDERRPLRTATMVLGAWTVVTASTSVFFASLLAVDLVPVPRMNLAAGLGLVIWALSSVVFTALEAMAVSSLAGTIFRAATAGLRSSLNGLSSVFSRPTESKNVQASLPAGGGRRLGDEIRQFLNDIAPRRLAPERLRTELRALLNDADIKAIAESHPGWDRIVGSLHVKSGMSADQAREWTGIVKNVLATIPLGRAATPESLVLASSQPHRRGHDQRAQAMAKLEKYLTALGQPAQGYNALRRDFERVLADPVTGAPALLDRLKGMDLEAMRALVNATGPTSNEDAERLVSRVEAMRSKVVSVVENTGANVDRRRQGPPEALAKAAEETRQTAAIAAWWAFGTALASAAAGVAGGVCAMKMGL